MRAIWCGLIICFIISGCKTVNNNSTNDAEQPRDKYQKLVSIFGNPTSLTAYDDKSMIVVFSSINWKKIYKNEEFYKKYKNENLQITEKALIDSQGYCSSDLIDVSNTSSDPSYNLNLGDVILNLDQLNKKYLRCRFGEQVNDQAFKEWIKK